ncbi:hypothetical protein Taro_025401 [Colocasia esculenta]|uniref:Uncharacterized protein n=1 Tax=Colocasia esculenta TaxID=4460 RepID=A0A843VGG0_COLES|nr:hypothetical protein [Colocasia esculenta]
MEISKICLAAEVATHRAVATWSRRPTLSRSRRDDPSHRNWTEGGSGPTPPRTTPKMGKQPHKGERIMLNMLES